MFTAWEVVAEGLKRWSEGPGLEDCPSACFLGPPSMRSMDSILGEKMNSSYK
jgi:hypothetical protein